MKSVGFGTFETNLLTIPAYVLFIIQLLFWTWISEKFSQRLLVALVSQIWALPILIALETIPAATGAWVRWGLSTLLVGHPYVHAILVAITSRNAGTVRTRTIATAMYNMCVQTSSVIGSNVSDPIPHTRPKVLANLMQIYRDDDKPLYRKGNAVLIAICAYNIMLFIGAKVFYVQVNKRRTRLWDRMSTEEKERYLSTTTDKGNRRLDFRFAH